MENSSNPLQGSLSSNSQPQTNLSPANSRLGYKKLISIVAGTPTLLIICFYFLLILIVLLVLNYKNVIPLSQKSSFFGFLPHESTLFSKKIANLNTPFPYFNTGLERVITAGEDIQMGGKSCPVCASYQIITAAYKEPKTGNVNVIGSRGGKYFLFHNGSESKGYGKFGSAVFSKDGKRMMAVLQNDKQRIVFVDGVEIGTYGSESIDARVENLAFSPNGNSYVFSVTEFGTTANSRKEYIVNDGHVKKKYTGISAPTFSPDSKHLAYIAHEENLKFVVRDDKESSIKASWIGSPQVDNGLVFSPDGKKLAYILGKGAEAPFQSPYVLVINDKETSPAYSSGISSITFSPDSRRIAYISREISGSEDNVSLNLDGKVLKTSKKLNSYYGFENLTFSTDSKQFIYSSDGALYNEDSARLGNAYGLISNVVFSPDGKRVAHNAITADTGAFTGILTLVDGKEYQAYSPYRNIVFSRDSKHVAFWGQSETNLFQQELANPEVKGQSNVVIDDKTGKTYDNFEVPIYESDYSSTYKFSPYRIEFTDDGKYIIYNVRSGNELWLIVRDIKTGEEILKPQ